MHRACICNPRDLAIEEFVEFLIIYAQKDQSIDFRQYQILYICIVIAFVCPPRMSITLVFMLSRAYQVEFTFVALESLI